MSIAELLRNTPIFPLAKSVRKKFLIAMGKQHPIQAAKVSNKYPLIHLGSEYGGWIFVDVPELKGSTILAAGLGEDASFDVEFATHFEASIVIVDPTPRAVEHFNGITARLGQGKTSEYSQGGCQTVESYDLSKLSPEQLKLEPVALWVENTTVKFYEPKNKQHVSHSITNYQNDFSEETDFKEVPAFTIASVLEKHSINPDSLQLVKLDIEGAEIEVVKNMMAENILPRQLLLEFDELNVPSKKSVSRVDQTHKLLLQKGYQLIYTDGMADFLYVHDM